MNISQATSGLCEETEASKHSFSNVVMLCRICLDQERVMKNMFDSTDPVTDSIIDRILYCTGVKFSQQDGLSERICTLCLDHLAVAHKFKLSCVSADEMFSKLIKEQITFGEPVEVNNEFDDDAKNIKRLGCAGVPNHDNNIDDGINVKIEPLSGAEDYFNDDEMENESKPDIETEAIAVKKKRKYKIRVPRQKNKLIFRRYHCKFCKIYFKTKEESDSHRKIHKNKECFVCEICGKSFVHRSSHYSHIRSHLAPKHECPHCDYKTWHKHDLKKHTRIHTGEKIYQCEYCSSAFHTSSNLSDHTRRNHSAVKAYRFTCSRCGKQYYDRTKFERHMDSHDEIKRHICDVCHSCFTRRCYWKKHLLSQHGIVVPPMRPGRRKINALKLTPDDLQEGQ